MRKRYFFHTITDKDEIFSVKKTVKDEDGNESTIVMDKIKAIKINNKPYVFSLSTPLNVGDNVMIIRPGSAIDVGNNSDFKRFFDFLPECHVYTPTCDEPTHNDGDGRRVSKRKFGNVLSHGVIISEKEVENAGLTFVRIIPFIGKFISFETAQMIRRHIACAEDCLRSAQHLYEDCKYCVDTY